MAWPSKLCVSRVAGYGSPVPVSTTVSSIRDARPRLPPVQLHPTSGISAPSARAFPRHQQPPTPELSCSRAAPARSSSTSSPSSIRAPQPACASIPDAPAPARACVGPAPAPACVLARMRASSPELTRASVPPGQHPRIHFHARTRSSGRVLRLPAAGSSTPPTVRSAKQAHKQLDQWS